MSANALAVRDPAHADIVSPTAPDELRVLAAVLTRYSPPAYAANTGKAYLSDLRIWGAWCMEQGLPLFAAARGDVERWMRDTAGQGAATRTIRRRLAAVTAYYEEAADQGLVDRVPTQRVRRPPEPRARRLGVDRSETLRVLEAARRLDDEADEVEGPQNEPLFRLLATDGLRASEAASLTAGSFGRAGGHRVVRFTGKGGKDREEAMSEDTAVAVDRLLAHRRGGARDLDPAAPAFVTSSGKRMSRWDVRRRTITLGRAAGVTIRLNPHVGRHAFVTLSLQAGVPLQQVQEDAAHQNPQTTIGYNDALRHLEDHSTHRLSQWLKEEDP